MTLCCHAKSPAVGNSCLACRYLAQIQDMQDEDINTQAMLEGILGEHIHLAHSINKLLLLENAVYH